jgi:hypothetical protein
MMGADEQFDRRNFSSIGTGHIAAAADDLAQVIQSSEEWGAELQIADGAQ